MVELLIYMALLVIFLTVLMDVFVTTLNFKLQSESTSALNQDTRFILEKISYDLYNADNFTVPSPTQVSFTFAGTNNSYTISGGDLLRNSVKLNGTDTNVQSLTFTQIDNTLKVSFTLESQINLPGGPRTQSVVTTVAPR